MLVGQEHLITDQIPENMYIDNFRNDKELSFKSLSDKMNLDLRGGLDNWNKPQQIERTRIAALEHLRHLEFAPGAQLSVAYLHKVVCLYHWHLHVCGFGVVA